MRKSFSNKSLIVEGDTFYGVSLGFDFCAEHEWGIKKMRASFGVDTTKMGIEGRRISKSNILFKEDDDLCVLTSHVPYKIKENYTAKDLLAYDIRDMRDSLECAWDESSFCIASKSKKQFAFIRQLYESFQNNNIIIASIKSNLNPFANTALSVLIADRLPKEVIDELFFVDKKQKDLNEYEEQIGVSELKRTKTGYKGGKYFMACSPRWINYEDIQKREEQKKEMKTKYDIMFWVNYSDDDDNYGWYTAEKIIKWLSTPDLKLKSLNK